MKIGILTTDTPHHRYFLNRLSLKFKELSIFFEDQVNPIPSKLTPFEKKRNKFEQNYVSKMITKINKNCFNYSNIKNKKLISIIKQNCDYIVVFGTSKIKGDILKIFKNKIFNLHGGNPEKYRGLDSHYWSIYHNDFSSLESTLHILDKNFDTGKIIFKKKLKINKNTKIFQLRMINTQLLTDITIKHLNNLLKKKKFICSKQKSTGRYYSYMPYELKKNIEKKFNSYLKKL